MKQAQVETAVATVEKQAVARPMDQQSFDIEGMFRYAIDKGADMTTLMNVRRELNQEAAKKAFDDALSSFQAECPVITKTRGVSTSGGQVAYKYAPIELVEFVIRPIESKYGFSHTFDSDVSSQDGWVIASCIVTHRAGHTRTATIKLPLGTKTNIMSNTQVHASALTFANRRALTNVYGLVLAGEDFDGGSKPKAPGPQMAKPAPQPQQSAPQPQQSAPEQHKPAPQQKELLKSIWELCKKNDATLTSRKTWDAINDWMRQKKILADNEELPNLTKEKLLEVLDKTDISFNP